MTKTQAELFGENLVKAMGSMSLAELARKANLNRQQVHRYVNGKALPRADSFMRICEALSLDPWTATEGASGQSKPRLERFDSDLFGNAKNPSTDQFPSGNYEFYSANPRIIESITRVILVIENDGAICRVRSILPVKALPAGTPYSFRRMTGLVKVKFEQSYYLTLQNQNVPNSEEKLFATVMLGSEEPTRRIRKGVTMRFVPYPGSESFASKVLVRRLESTTYRRARKLPAVFTPDQAPDFVREYFLTPSKYPYHFGPSVDVETPLRTASLNRSMSTEPETDAARKLHGLQHAMGGGSYPTEDEFESGVYDLYAAFNAETPKLLRIPFLIGGTHESGRWAFSRLPGHFYPFPVPKVIRDMTGEVIVKQGDIIHIFGVIRARDGRDNHSHYYRFGSKGFKSGARLGFVVFPDLDALGPIACRAVLIRSSEQNFPRAFRQTKALSVEDAPVNVRDYFQKQETAPYILSTHRNPRIF